MKYLLDTNVISELVAKTPNQAVLDWVDALDPDNVFLSVIAIGEVSKGIERLPESAKKQRLTVWLKEDLLSRFTDRILPIDVEVMLQWGQLSASLEKSGTSLPAINSVLASIALVNGCVLVTRNVDDFNSAGVALINPWTVRLDRPA